MRKAKGTETIVLEAKRGDMFFLMTFAIAMFATTPLMLLSVIFIRIGGLLLIPSGMLARNLADYSMERAKQKNAKQKPKSNK